MARLVPLALCLSLAASAGLAAPLPAAPANPAVLKVADGAFQAEKQRYIEQARAEMARWKNQLDSVAGGSDTAAYHDLDTAWHRAKLEEYQLEGATQAGWKRAKGSFEDASHRLSDTWSRQHQ